MVTGKPYWFPKNRTSKIYALKTLIRNRTNETHCSHIYMEKAFHWGINRFLMMYRSLSYGTDGKMYKSIKALFTNIVELHWSLRSEWFENICGLRRSDYQHDLGCIAMHLIDNVNTRPQQCAHKLFLIMCRYHCDSCRDRGIVAKST